MISIVILKSITNDTNNGAGIKINVASTGEKKDHIALEIPKYNEVLTKYGIDFVIPWVNKIVVNKENLLYTINNSINENALLLSTLSNRPQNGDWRIIINMNQLGIINKGEISKISLTKADFQEEHLWFPYKYYQYDSVDPYILQFSETSRGLLSRFRVQIVNHIRRILSAFSKRYPTLINEEEFADNNKTNLESLYFYIEDKLLIKPVSYYESENSVRLYNKLEFDIDYK